MNVRIVILCALVLMLGSQCPIQAEVHTLHQQAKAEKDTEKAIELYWQFIEEASGDSSFPEAMRDFARLLAKTNRFAEMIRLGDSLSQLLPPPADPMNTIAWSLASNDTALSQALRYSRLAVAAQKPNTWAPPKGGYSQEAWKERQNSILGTYMDTQGYICLKLDKNDEALKVLSQADSLAEDPEIQMHLAQAYLRNGKADEALQLAIQSRYGYGTDENSKLNQIIREAFQSATGNTEGIDRYIKEKLNELKDEEYAQLVSERLDYPAKDFTLTSLDGESVRLADYQGKIVLLDFWATWCGPCRMELPLLQSNFNRWKEQGIELLAISTDQDTTAVAPFIAQNQYSFPVLFDEHLKEVYGVPGIPTLFVIDQEGKVQYKHIGYRPDIVEILDIQINALKSR